MNSWRSSRHIEECSQHENRWSKLGSEDCCQSTESCKDFKAKLKAISLINDLMDPYNCSESSRTTNCCLKALQLPCLMSNEALHHTRTRNDETCPSHINERQQELKNKPTVGNTNMLAKIQNHHIDTRTAHWYNQEDANSITTTGSRHTKPSDCSNPQGTHRRPECHQIQLINSFVRSWSSGTRSSSARTSTPRRASLAISTRFSGCEWNYMKVKQLDS